MKIYLLRHTQVAVAEGICYGQSDVDLSADWADAFARVKAKLPPQALTAGAIYSSPLQRCLRLARWLGDANANEGLQVAIDERLMELNFGRWEGRLWNAIEAETMALWRDDYWSRPPPEGESFAELYTRCTAFFEELLQRPVETTLVVTHGGVILALLAHLLKLPPGPQAFRLKVDYGGLSAISVAGEWVKIDYINR